MFIDHLFRHLSLTELLVFLLPELGNSEIEANNDEQVELQSSFP